MERIIKKSSFEQVISSWLKDEWHYSFYDDFRNSVTESLVSYPDLSNQEENAKRLELLLKNRNDIISQLPADMEWFETDFIQADIDHTYLISTSWCKDLTEGTCQLRRACKSLDKKLASIQAENAEKIRGIQKSAKKQKQSPILIASGTKSARVIIEGNHRTIALTEIAIQEGHERIFEKIYLGISKKICGSTLFGHEW